MRIVSLLPSATEIICQIGLGDQLAGVTHECDHPPFVADLPKVTRTLIPHDASSAEIDRLVRERLTTRRALYTLDLPVLERLAPDLIVTQALCDVCAVAEEEVTAAACRLPGNPPVVNLEPTRFAELYDCMRLVGAAAGVATRAEEAIAALARRVDAVERRSKSLERMARVVLLEWIDPLFCCGHWSPELLRIAGGVEGIGREGEPSRTTDWEEILRFDPEFLLIACCGFSVERTLVDIPSLRRLPRFTDLLCVRNQNVFVIDGNAYFSRPGPRLVDGLEIVAHLLHPQVHPLPDNLIPARRLSANELGTEP